MTQKHRPTSQKKALAVTTTRNDFFPFSDLASFSSCLQLGHSAEHSQQFAAT